MTVLVDAGAAVRRRLLRPEPERAAPTTDHLVRPRLQADVTVHPPIADGSPWMAQRGENHYFRLGADLARLASALDGARDHAALARVLGAPWTGAAVGAGVAALDRAQLLERDRGAGAGSARRHHGRHRAHRPSRLRVVPPLTVQLAILRSGDRAAGILDRLLGRAFPAIAITLAALGVAGTGATFWHWDETYAVLASPLDPLVLLLVAGSLSLTTVVHELAHAWTLKHYGGRPGRMGIMLFYLAPAFFCDVSDAWRLPLRSQRVKVALAGIVVQLGLGGLSGLAALAVADPDWHALLVLYAVGNLVSGLLNALPFVKLDGYIALMSHLDHPNLRIHAIDTVRASVVRFLSRAPRPTRGQARAAGWQLPFGLACLVLPILLIARGLDSLLLALTSLGTFGIMIVGSALLAITWAVARGARRTAAEIRAAGPRWGRLAAAGAAGALALGALGALPVPTSSNAGFTVRADGAVDLVVPEGQPPPVLQTGDRVELLRSGLLLQTPDAKAVVADRAGRSAMAPLSSFAPVRLDGIPVPVQAYPLQVSASPTVTAGQARFHHRSVPLAELLAQRLLAPIRPTT